MDPHFLLLNWKRDIFGDILCPSEGQWPPHISSFVAWSRSSSHMWGTQVTCCPCQEHLPHLKDGRKEVILFLFSFCHFHSFIGLRCLFTTNLCHWIWMHFPCDLKPNPAPGNCAHLVINVNNLVITVSVWNFDNLRSSVSAWRHSRSDVTSHCPIQGPELANFRTENKAMTTLTLLAMTMGSGNSKWLW